jgi:bacterioferritin
MPFSKHLQGLRADTHSAPGPTKIGGLEDPRTYDSNNPMSETFYRRRPFLARRFRKLYRELLDLVKDKSVVLEEYATRMIAAEAVHIREMELMLMKRAPD